MSERVGFCRHFKAVISLVQSPLAMWSRLGLGRWAKLQRHQDAIRYGRDSGCNNDGVHNGLVFTVIVTRSLSSFHYSRLMLFSLLTSWWSSLRWLLLLSDTFRRVRKEYWNRRVPRERVVCSLCRWICQSQSL